ncbi:hypothetical protein SNE40_005664 [Patella caerulea]|uniref:Uncharacterized protein n=1 Tax=Patella caerulea TaxID=87958 RepID=A0AAN8JXF9_PATCE
MESATDHDLAKDYGFDVTVPNGGILSSAASNRLYKTECRKIYSEFLLNMRDYIFKEEQIKQELSKIHDDPAFPNRNQDFYNSMSSRRSACLRNSINDATGDEHVGPKNKHPCGSIKISKPRPKTVSESRRKSSNDANCESKSSNERLHSVNDKAIPRNTRLPLEQHDAIVDSKSDYASSRKIKMNPRAFSRLVSGKANIRVLNKDNGYVIHPVSESRTSHLMPKDVDRSSVSERLAVVRQKTNYKSPTLSHDLKVNNIVAIKKSLQGDDSTPRLSVGDVMLSARERRSRLFRIQLTNDHIEAKPSDMDIKSPKRNNYFPQVKRSDSKGSSPRLTRQNLARMEMNLQKQAIEKLRNTVIMMTSSLEDPKEDAHKRNKSHLSVLADPPQNKTVDSVDYLSGNETINHNSDKNQNEKILSLRESRNRNVLSKSESQRIYGTPLLRLKDSPRSELSMRPPAIQSGFRSQGSSPRRVSHHDMLTYVRRSKEDDEDRDLQMNRWRQRMAFAVGRI